jgi:hypothetical protein
MYTCYIYTPAYYVYWVLVRQRGMVLSVVLLSMETTYGWLAMHSHARAVRVSVGVWLRALTSHDSPTVQ